MDGLWIVQMLLSTGTHFMSSRAVQCQIVFKTKRIKGFGMKFFDLFLDIFQGKTAHTADRVGKVLINDRRINTDCFKVLGALIGLDRGNTHLGRNLDNTM